MRIGSRVLLKYNNKVVGTVKDSRPSTQMWLDAAEDEEYLVEYDNEDYIPTSDWHPSLYLQIIEEPKKTLTCDCGGIHTSTSTHFDWCMTLTGDNYNEKVS